MPASILPPIRTPFRAIATTIVPEAASLDDAGWSALERIVSDALGARPPHVQRQVLLFVRIVERLPLVRYGRTFSRLSPARRRAVLGWLQDAPLLLLRRGVWGIRTLVFMGYYARPEAARAIGYRADPRGWDARRVVGAAAESRGVR